MFLMIRHICLFLNVRYVDNDTKRNVILETEEMAMVLGIFE